MKNNKSNKIVSILNFLASFCFYICAIINFINDSGMGALYLCLGSTFLCLGAVWLNKDKDKEDKKEDKEDKEDK